MLLTPWRHTIKHMQMISYPSKNINLQVLARFLLWPNCFIKDINENVLKDGLKI